MNADRRPVEDRASSVVVTLADFATRSYARAVADEFIADVLEVSGIDGDRGTIEILPPGTWRDATVFGADGYPIYATTSRMEAERLGRRR